MGKPTSDYPNKQDLKLFEYLSYVTGGLIVVAVAAMIYVAATD